MKNTTHYHGRSKETKSYDSMKRIPSAFLLILTTTLIIHSCGRWSDNIKLSTRSAEFSANGDSIIITTGGDWWWLTEIRVDSIHFYNFDPIDVLADSYKVIQDCFVFERRDKNTIFIKLEANPLNTERIVFFELEAGDYFDRIKITQNPK